MRKSAEGGPKVDSCVRPEPTLIGRLTESQQCANFAANCNIGSPPLGPKLGRDHSQAYQAVGHIRPGRDHPSFPTAESESRALLLGRVHRRHPAPSRLYSATSGEKGVEAKNANRPNLRTDVVHSPSFSPQNSPVQGNCRSSSYSFTSCSIAISAHPSTICSFFGHSSQNLSFTFTHHVQPCRECHPPRARPGSPGYRGLRSQLQDRV